MGREFQGRVAVVHAAETPTLQVLIATPHAVNYSTLRLPVLQSDLMQMTSRKAQLEAEKASQGSHNHIAMVIVVVMKIAITSMARVVWAFSSLETIATTTTAPTAAATTAATTNCYYYHFYHYCYYYYYYYHYWACYVLPLQPRKSLPVSVFFQEQASVDKSEALTALKGARELRRNPYFSGGMSE